MSEQVDRELLLKRWAELAPGECTSGLLSDGQVVWGFNGGPLVNSPHFFPAILLAGLIEAIKNRGWLFHLEGDAPMGEDENPAYWYDALVDADGQGFQVTLVAEPCDALLSAYVQAIETIGGEHATI